MSEPLVSIITVNYNQADTTCALLDSIRRQDYRNVEVFVVDNASREDPSARLARDYPEVRSLRSPQNLGFAGGNNLALREAKGDYLFFVNNDAEVTPGCLRQLTQHFENQPNTGIVSPLICYFPEGDAPHIIQYAGMTPVHPLTGRNRVIGHLEPQRGQYVQPVRTAYAHGAAMMVPHRVLQQVGPMSEDFFLYYEELDWCERIRKAGWEVWVAPRALVWHKESLTVARMGSLKTFYLTRNRIGFVRRHAKGGQLAAFYVFLWAVTVPKNTLAHLLRGEWANLKAFWRGVRAGMG